MPYLSRKTHRQLERWVMIPPSTGPRTLAMIKTEDMMPMYLPYSLVGIIMGAMVRTIEYIPEAPIP